MLSKLASFVDHRLVRGALTAVLIVACVLLGPLSVLAAAFGPREPILMALGLCGLAGLIGACARLWLGPRFFHASRWVKSFVPTFLALGTGAAIAASFALPWHIYMATLMPLVGLLGLVLLAGSIRPGPNNSFKPTPLRGAA